MRLHRRGVAVLMLVALGTQFAYAERIPADLDGDGDVDFEDFLTFASDFGRKDGTPYDPSAPQVADTVRVTVVDTALRYPSGEWVRPSSHDLLTIASWNVRILSDGSRDDTELEQIAGILSKYHLVAIQELRDEVVMDRLLEMLGPGWSAIVSEEVGTESSTERYAFVYQDSRVQALDQGAFWDDSADQFIREPFYASFRAGSFDFTLITIHSIFGSTKGERRAEAELVDDVYQELQDADPDEQDLIVLGDFNLEPEDEGFDQLRPLLTALFTGDIRTTISEASLYDNIWIGEDTGEYSGEWGVDRFDQILFGNDDSAASLAVSDHRPVWATFDTSSDDD